EPRRVGNLAPRGKIGLPLRRDGDELVVAPLGQSGESIAALRVRLRDDIMHEGHDHGELGRLETGDPYAGQGFAGVLVRDDTDDRLGRGGGMGEARSVVDTDAPIGAAPSPSDLERFDVSGQDADFLGLYRRSRDLQLDNALAADAADREPSLGIS